MDTSPTLAGLRDDRWSALLDRRYLPALLTVTLGVGLFSFNEFLVSTALPSAVRDTGGAALMSWGVTVYLVPSIVSGVSAASLKQRFGARMVLLVSGMLFLAGTLVASSAGSMQMILVGRALQGAGDGVIAALCYALIPALFPSALIARVFGIEALVWASSAFGGPLVSGWVTQMLSWRAAFLVNVPVILSFLAVMPFVTGGAAGERAGAEGMKLFRLSGIAVGIMAVAVAAVLARVEGKIACLALALVLLVWTVRADRTCPDRLFPASIFRLSSRMGAIYWVVLLMPLAQAVSGVYLVLALQQIWGFRPAVAGAVAAAMALSWSSFTFLIAGLPRWRHVLARLGPALNAAGLLILWLAMRSGWVGLVIAAQIVIGAGFGLCWSILSQDVMEAAEPGDRDRATALLPTVQSAGYALGAAFAGVIANLAGLPQVLRQGGSVAAPLSSAYGVAVLIALAASGIGLMFGERKAA